MKTHTASNGAKCRGFFSHATATGNLRRADARGKSLLLFFAVTGLCIAAQAIQVIYIGGTYSENFDSMGSAGIATPNGWFVGTSGNGTVTAGQPTAPKLTGAISSTAVVVSNGTGTSAGNFNYGTTSASDRALGSLAGSTSQRDTEVQIVNNTGFSIAQFTISYDGEQWRDGGSAVVNTLTMQFSTDGTTYVNLGSSFNFSSLQNTIASAVLDGNAVANRTVNIGGAYTPASPVANGATIYLRWADPDDGGSDSGMAVDNFTFSTVPEPSTCLYGVIGVVISWLASRKSKRPAKRSYAQA